MVCQKKILHNFDILIDAFHDGVVVVEDGKVCKVNQSFCRITGLKREIVEKKELLEFLNSSHVCLKSIFEVCNLAYKMKKAVTILRKMTQGNEIFITATPIKIGQKVRHMIVCIRDVTELKKLQEQVSQLSGLYLSATESDVNYKLLTDGIVAESPPMRNLVELAIRMGSVDSVVLIQGESGTGKEVLARLIHRVSERKNRAFVSINCAAIPESLLESELFGYEKGAFSGALREGKPGLFEIADGGTLFLDEVGELPLNLQAKLLRFLQDQEIYRVGGTRPISLNVRVIAATNRDLKEMVKKGVFREDLYYRLDVVPIYVPPLRERREDIFPLAWRFLQHFNQRYKQSKSFSEPLITALESYKWPGNVRELQNIIERLVVTSKGSVLTPEDLPSYMAEEVQLRVPFTGTIAQKVPQSLREMKETAERLVLMDALKKGKTTREIGAMLGVHHSTVVRKLQKYHLQRPDR